MTQPSLDNEGSQATDKASTKERAELELKKSRVRVGPGGRRFPGGLPMVPLNQESQGGLSKEDVFIGIIIC